MLDSFNAQRIASSLDGLSREVHALQYEVARHRDEVARLRDKLGPQPEWLLIMFFGGAIMLAVALLIIAAARRQPAPKGAPARVEQQVELPESATR